MNIIIRSELPDDIPMIRKVNEAAFDTNAEADLIDRLRDEGAMALSLVAVRMNKIVGQFFKKVLTSKYIAIIYKKEVFQKLRDNFPPVAAHLNR